MRTLISVAAASCLLIGMGGCTKTSPDTEPATREAMDTFESSARRACARMIGCLAPAQKNELSRVQRASNSFPEYGRICLHETKASARLKPAGQACIQAATAYMVCRESMPCSASWQNECTPERATVRNQCGDFLGSPYPPHAN